MKKQTIWTVLMAAVLLLQVTFQTVFVVTILKMNMLPDMLGVLLVVAMVLLAGATGMLLFVHGKRPVGKIRRILACVLAFVIVCSCGVGMKLAKDLNDTVNKVTGGVTTSVRNVYVFVRSADPAQTLSDAADYTFGFIENYDGKHTQQAITQIEQTVENTIAVSGYLGFQELADALLGKDVGAVIMNGASVSLLEEVEGYEDFTEKVRILETMSFTQLEQNTEPTVTEETEPVEQNITNTPFVLYISGSDTRNKKLSVSRSDVNILAVVNPQTKQVLLINTPRDYYVENPAGDGARDKLTHCGLYGPECSMEALGNLYELDVDYYCQINFTGFETLIDAIGGITVYSDQSFKPENGIFINVGENVLNGKQALAFARDRYHVSGGDNGRGKNQMKVIKAVIDKLTSGTTIISNYSSILGSLEGMFTTSMTAEDISSLVKMQLSDMASWNVHSYASVGVGASEKTYSAPGLYAYVMYEDEASTAYASELANRVIAGETLTDADMAMPK